MRRPALVTLVLLLLIGGGVPARGADPVPSPDVAAVTVTLITGDRVTLRDEGVAIAASRPGISFHTTIVDGSVRVVPSDVAPLLGTSLDPALFDVSLLARMGATETLPVIVSPVPVGVAAGRLLPSINAAAVTLRPGERAALSFTGSRIWLDGLATADATTSSVPRSWDGNLLQVGAPQAWQAGLTGAGVRVAVLDTGVDASHPDLTGRVAVAENFTDSPHATDRNGHGTHVASLIAGTGVASAQTRRGVAFEASLLAGKVLGDDGVGQFSDIIAGMEWAVAQGARVVNMSLSSPGPSNGKDPLSLAVAALSDKALFVVSAGNNGPKATTIGAPGASDAALTVGAVDRRDRLAAFSSRGPRFGDYGIKPDLVAPGVDIIAARAAGTQLGDPVGAHYVRLSGTSMAAPHASGGAALVAQEHPHWTGQEIKSALMGTAAAVGGAFEAGSGRLDLAAPRGVHAVTPSLSFGFAAYPQTGLPPIERTLTLANPAESAVTIDLTSQLHGPDGRPAPTGMLTFAPAQITIPAKAQASTTVRVAVASGGFGNYTGAVSAQGLRVPVGVVKESTRHTVRLRAVDRNGESKVETLAWLANLDDTTASPVDPVLLVDGAADVRLQPGHYTITAAIPTAGDGDPPPDLAQASTITIAAIGEVAVFADREVVLDARPGVPISAQVSGAQTTPVDLQVFVATKDRRGNRFVLNYATSAQDVVEGLLFVTPTVAPKHGTLELSSKWRLTTLDGESTYDLLFAGPSFPAVMTYVAQPRDLATVNTVYRSPVDYREGRFVFTEVNSVSVAIFQAGPIAPAHRVEHLAPGRKWQWFQCTNVEMGGEGIGGFCQAPAGYSAGKESEHGWLRAPLRTRAAASRTATHLFLGMDDLAADGPVSGSIQGHAFSARSFQLYRNGTLIADGTDTLGGFAVPAGPATFRLQRKVQLRDGLFGISTRVDSAWTFHSTPPCKGVPSTAAPVMDIAVHAPVDDANRLAGQVPIDLEVWHPGGRVTQISLQISLDEGGTWQAVPLSRNSADVWAAVVTFPNGPVWLRTTATDAAGNAMQQTIQRPWTT